MKLHRMIDHIKKKCSAQKPVLCISYCLSYWSLLIFILYFCPGPFSLCIEAMVFKLHRMIDLVEKKCSVQELSLLVFDLLPFIKFHTLFLSGLFLINYKSYRLETS
jgi:hypothetical protein